jgi:hypothetical protein
MQSQRVEALNESIQEAERFLGRAKEAKKALTAKDQWRYQITEFAAAKRSSMDLTRSLAKLRRAQA